MYRFCLITIVAASPGLVCGCKRSDGPTEDAATPKDAVQAVANGSVRVLGKGADLYHVFDEAGVEQIGFTKTGNVLEVPPGTYRVELNNSRKSAQVAPSTETTLGTGTLTVAGTGANMFRVFDTQGETRLAFKYTNSQIELFEGSYVLKLNNSSHDLRLDVGDDAVIEAGSILVAGAGEDLYYVYDESGDRKLEFTSTGKALEIFPGTYTVVCKDKRFRVVVRAKEQAKVTLG